jgi:hypothetical protein
MTIDPGLFRVLVAQRYALLFATISSLHLYGFPSANSEFNQGRINIYHTIPEIRIFSKDQVTVWQ